MHEALASCRPARRGPHRRSRTAELLSAVRLRPRGGGRRAVSVRRSRRRIPGAPDRRACRGPGKRRLSADVRGRLPLLAPATRSAVATAGSAVVRLARARRTQVAAMVVRCSRHWRRRQGRRGRSGARRRRRGRRWARRRRRGRRGGRRRTDDLGRRRRRAGVVSGPIGQVSQREGADHRRRHDGRAKGQSCRTMPGSERGKQRAPPAPGWDRLVVDRRHDARREVGDGSPAASVAYRSRLSPRRSISGSFRPSSPESNGCRVIADLPRRRSAAATARARGGDASSRC